MSIDVDRRTQTLSAVMADAARVAEFAPSLHNAQPWRWLVDGAALELYAEPTRQSNVDDPGGRLMVLSCGAALHHARIALAAGGWRVVVERLAGLDRPQLLARLTVTRETTPSPDAKRLLRTVHLAGTDQRPTVDDVVLDQSRMDTIRLAVEAEHSSLHTLRADDLLDLAMAASGAEALEEFDPHWQQAISHWRAGLGAADSTIRQAEAAATDPGRDLGRAGGGAIYAILFGDGDTPAAWLYAGEALSAAWLAAAEVGVRALPLSAAVEWDGTRRTLRGLVSRAGEPFLVLGLGLAELDRSLQSDPGPVRAAPIVEIVGGGTGAAG